MEILMYINIALGVSIVLNLLVLLRFLYTYKQQQLQKAALVELIRLHRELEHYDDCIGADIYDESELDDLEYEESLEDRSMHNLLKESLEDVIDRTKAHPIHIIDRNEAKQERLNKNPHRELEIEIEDSYDDQWEH
jgi:hypothetical protein